MPVTRQPTRHHLRALAGFALAGLAMPAATVCALPFEAGFDAPIIERNAPQPAQPGQPQQPASAILPETARLLDAAGIDDEQERQRIGVFLQSLNGPTAGEREMATNRLLSDHALNLRRVEAMLSTEDLTAEARIRLEIVARERFNGGPWGGMGIRMSLEGDRAVIQEAIAGFPAFNILRAGDVILEADGLKVVNNADLRAAILSLNAFGVMRSVILRDGERMPLDIPLGSYGSLNNVGAPASSDLDAAWARRRYRADLSRQAFAVTLSPPPGRALDPDEERDSAFEFESVAETLPLDAILWLTRADLEAPGVIAGGVPTGGLDHAGRLRLRVQGVDVALPPSRSITGSIWPADDLTNRRMGIMDIETMDEERASVLARFAISLHRQSLEVEQLIAFGQIAELDPQRDQQRRREIELRIDAIDRQIRELDDIAGDGLMRIMP